MELKDDIIESNFERFIGLIEKSIHREGIDKLVAWLKSKDTKIAPASTKYHLSCKGGLVQHCLNVYDKLRKTIELDYGFPYEDAEDGALPYTQETIVLVALLHDISKINFYEIQEKNVKDPDGNWTKVPYYSIKDGSNRLIYGSHSLNSVYMISKFINLTYEEELAILHHMGGKDFTEDGGALKNTADAFKKSELAVRLHIADLWVTFRDEC